MKFIQQPYIVSFAENPIVFIIECDKASEIELKLTYEESHKGKEITKTNKYFTFQSEDKHLLKVDIAPLIEVPKEIDYNPLKEISALDKFGSAYSVTFSDGKGGGLSNIGFVLPGGISPTLQKYLQENKLNIFEWRLRNKYANFLLSTRSMNNVIELRESELTPLPFLSNDANAIIIRNENREEIQLTQTHATGVEILNVPLIYQKLGATPGLYKVLVNRRIVFGFRILPAVNTTEHYILTFRNSYGAFEAIELSGVLYHAPHFEDEESYLSLHDLHFYDKQRLRLDSRPTFKASTGYKTKKEHAFIADLISSDEAYLHISDELVYQVNITPDEYQYTEFFVTPQSVTLTLEAVNNSRLISARHDEEDEDLVGDDNTVFTWWECLKNIEKKRKGDDFSKTWIGRADEPVTILDTTSTFATIWTNFPSENTFDGYVTDDIRKAINQRTTPLELIFPDGTHINGACFQNVAKISKVTAPVCQYVGSSAFAGSSVTAFDTQGALVEIDKGAFTYCKSLKSIGSNLNNLKIIGDSAFRYCQNTDFKLPNMPSLEYIGGESFQESGIISIGNMPKLTAMKQTAFASTPIESVGDTPLLPVINPYAFWHCSKLKSFSNNTGATIVQNNAFNGCTSLESINMPKVTGITNNAFENCTNLKTLTFPQLRQIQGKAFYGCDNIKSFNFGGSVTDGVGTVFSEIFTNTRTTVGTTPTFGSHFIQPSVNSDNDKVFNFNEYYWNTGHQTYKFKDGAYTLWEVHKYPEIIPNYTNSKLTLLDESITYAQEGWSIPENETFDGYTTNQFISQINANKTIKQLDCPLVSKLGIEAFKGLPNLDSIKIPNVKTIPGESFANSFNGKDISFPGVITVREYQNNWIDGGFAKCQARKITLENCTAIGIKSFAYCVNLEVLEIPLVRVITAFSFLGACKNKDISFPGELTVQGYGNNWNSGGFNGCLAKSIKLGNCTKVGTQAFFYCTNLDKLVLDNISDKIPILEANAFNTAENIDLTITGQWLNVGAIEGNVWTAGNYTYAFKSINGITANSLLSELSAQADNIVDNLHDIDQELHEKKEEIISDIYARTPMLMLLELGNDEEQKEQEEQAPLYNNLYVLKKMIDELGEDEVKERLKKTIKDNL